MELLSALKRNPDAVKLAATVFIAVLAFLLRRLAVRTFETSGLPPERRNRFLVQSRNAALLVFVGGTTVLWAEQLQSVALSVAALAAAFVIATKELILCLSGTLLRVSARSFKLGDRIEIQGSRGDVIDIGPMTTTILEVGPGPSIHKKTGRTIVLPNSLFLSAPVHNETFTGRYVLHTTTVHVPADRPWQTVEHVLLRSAEQVCASYIDDARENMKQIGVKHGLTPPDVTPQVWISNDAPAELELWLRFPAPIRGRGQIEQSILRRYLTELSELKPSDAVPREDESRAAETPASPAD